MNNKFNKQLIFKIDAFTSELLQGNPAAVCPLDNWLDDRLMQLIARENNLSETAFIVKNKNNGNYQIRWFTPSTEVDLCGHATLASAFVLFEILGYKENKINFESKSGELIVHKKDNLLQMDFPALPFTSIKPSLELIKAIKIVPDEVYQSKFDILCIFKDEQLVKEAKPDFYAMANIAARGIIFSSLAKNTDIYSRCFYPACDVFEDPVTGSAHCVIIPYWSKRLNKNVIHALHLQLALSFS